MDILEQMESALRVEATRYNELYQVSLTQAQILAESQPDLEAVVELAGKKEQLLGEIRGLDQQHQEIKERWKQVYETYSPEQRQTIAQLREQGMKQMEEMIHLEDEIAQLIRRHEQEIAQKVSSLKKGKQAQRAYLVPETGKPRFIDKKK